MKGIVLLNYYSPPKGCINQAERLKEEFAARGVEIEILPNTLAARGIGRDGSGFARLVKAISAYILIKTNTRQRYLSVSGSDFSTRTVP